MCLAPQRRAIFQQFFDIRTSKSGPSMWCFVQFDLQMCFSLQRRAILGHPKFQKWSGTLSFLAFWLANVLLATAACNFSTSQLQKVVREWRVLYILTSKCASRHNGVEFFRPNFKKWSEPISFLAFWLQNVLLATAACNFFTSQLQKVVWDRQFFSILTWKCASRYSGVQFFMSPLDSYLRTRRFTEVTFRPSRLTNHWQTQHFATSLTFRTCWPSFFCLSRNCIFFLLTLLLFSAFFIFWLCFSALLFQLSILSEVRLLNFLRLFV